MAPGSGVLWVERVVPGGTEVAAGTLLAEIAGDGQPRVEAWATTADLERLETGLEVDCRLPGSGAQYKARLRPVLPGSRSGGRIEILDGLRDGERVAVQGTELLADGLLAVEAENTP